VHNDKEKEKLMKINVFNNKKDIFFEYERNKYEFDETNNISTPNTSWFLLKKSKIDPKMNRYQLNPGEIFRIGRITLRIRDIIFKEKQKKIHKNGSMNDSSYSNGNLKEIRAMKTEGGHNDTLDNLNDDNKTPFKNKEKDTLIDRSEKLINITKEKPFKKNLTIFSKVEKKNIVCRICYIEEEDEQKNPLVQPCICDGSLKYIHLNCLKQWISTHSCINLDKNDVCSIFLIKPVECELCKTKFPDVLKHKNKLYPLLDFSSEYKSYLTIESLTLDKNKNKFIYVVSLEQNKKLKAGRGHECDILLSDISVSRVHSFFITENNNLFVEDNDSKFGTLIFIQNPRIKFSETLPLYVQIGRSSFEIKIRKNFKLFSCCQAEEKISVYYYYNQNGKYIKSNNGLVVKDDESDNEDDNKFYKNNNTQDIKMGNNSINIKEKDKMSDNEYLLIKHNKKKRILKKNIFYDETIDNQNTNFKNTTKGKAGDNKEEEEDEEYEEEEDREDGQNNANHTERENNNNNNEGDNNNNDNENDNDNVVENNNNENQENNSEGNRQSSENGSWMEQRNNDNDNNNNSTIGG